MFKIFELVLIARLCGRDCENLFVGMAGIRNR